MTQMQGKLASNLLDSDIPDRMNRMKPQLGQYTFNVSCKRESCGFDGTFFHSVNLSEDSEDSEESTHSEGDLSHFAQTGDDSPSVCTDTLCRKFRRTRKMKRYVWMSLLIDAVISSRSRVTSELTSRVSHE